MAELITAEQMQRVERAAMESGAVTGAQLMERAGQGVVDATLARWPKMSQGRWRATVLCGPGNNGGDGFVVARLLAARGWDVEVALLGEVTALRGDARANADRWAEIGPIVPLGENGLPWRDGTGLIVDALFGTGLNRPVRIGKVLRDLCDCVDGGSGQALEERLPHFPPVVAVDIPSGLCSDSGRVLSADARLPNGAVAACGAADLTVTFHRRKLGHVLQDGPGLCGEVVCVDIGLDSRPVREAVSLVAAPTGLAKRAGHKFDHGSALVLSGGVGKGGAARLAARAALRIGAGLVTVGCPPAALIENAAQLTAIMLRSLKDAGALSEALEDRRINAVCLGPGLGTGPRETGLVAAALDTLADHADRTLVLDGDALTLLSQDADLMKRLTEACVLTPHAGEFARLFPDLSERLDPPTRSGPAFSKVDAAREAALRCGATVVFKGPDTVIADAAGRCAVNDAVYQRAVPWLATAGAGDVLAGVITGLLARGWPPFVAAQAAAWLHVEAARSIGPGLIAEDLPDALPTVLRDLERGRDDLSG